MKKLERLPAPDCLDNNNAKKRKKKLEFYKNLPVKASDILPRWNTLDEVFDTKLNKKISKVRIELLEMSKDACAFCGKRINDNSLDVEHFLPKDEFPYLAYCWENYLPSCDVCNQNHKGTFFPNSLKGRELIDAVLKDTLFHQEMCFPLPIEVYNHQNILEKTKDRIIEPTFDNPEDHLEFLVAYSCYNPLTEIGKQTYNLFFKHKEVAELFEGLSKFIQIIVKGNENPQEVIEAYIHLNGYEYVCLKFLAYWLEEKEASRINR